MIPREKLLMFPPTLCIMQFFEPKSNTLATSDDLGSLEDDSLMIEGHGNM